LSLCFTSMLMWNPNGSSWSTVAQTSVCTCPTNLQRRALGSCNQINGAICFSRRFWPSPLPPPPKI
jgi:hypothetical protein